MYRKLDRHIGLHVLLAILLVLLIITGLDMLFSLLHELNEMGGDYGVPQVLWFIFLRIPGDIGELLPYAAMIGSLIGLGVLASNNELIVMRAAGVSIARIIWAVMKPTLVVLVAGMLIAEYVAPWTESRAQGDRAVAMGSGQAVGSSHGYWLRQGSEFVHINSVQPDGRLLGVTRYLFDDKGKLERSSFARQAIYVKGKWQVQDIRSTQLSDQRSTVQNQDSEPWNLALDARLLSSAMREPESLSIANLWGYSRYLKAQGLNSNLYRLTFWNKLLQPLVTLALVLMAISFIFGPLRSVTLGQRIFIGVLVGFIFRIFQQLLGPTSQVLGFPPLLAVLIPILVCTLLGVLLLRRVG